MDVRNCKAVQSTLNTSEFSRKLTLCSEQSGYPGTNSSVFGKDKRVLRSMETATKKDNSGYHTVVRYNV